MKRNLLLAGALAAASATNSLAASITDGHLKLTSADKAVFITVEGKIVGGDADSFGRLEANTKGPIVVIFNSPGGDLIEGLSIGERIKNHKDGTIASGTCGSACAYAWLAGSKRAMISGAQVIFHSPFRVEDESHADGTAGVVVGQYLAEIGVDLKTSMAITGHGPDDYYVLSSAAKNPIISFDVIDGQDHQVASAPSEQEPTQAPQSTVIRPTSFAMQCFPARSEPYFVIYAKGKSVVGTKTGKSRAYPVIKEHDDQSNHVFYVTAQRQDQKRALFYAFDYSQRGDDVSSLATQLPGEPKARDKCSMNWELTK